MVIRIGGRKTDPDESSVRVGKVPKPEYGKTPLVLTGPAQQVSSRQLRPRAVNMNHLAPDVKDALNAGGLDSGSTSNGRFWIIGGTLLVCTHRLSSLASGTETWTFPEAFSISPRVTATPFTNLSRFATVETITATSVVVRAWTEAGAASNVSVDVIAIGVVA